MPKLAIESWSLLEVEMNEKKNSFIIQRGLRLEDLATPGLKPTFVFFTSSLATIVVNDEGVFLLKYKYPKGAVKVKQPDYGEYLIPINATPKLTKAPSNHKKLAKKAIKQLFASGKITRG